jgi:hypothetical protein
MPFSRQADVAGNSYVSAPLTQYGVNSSLGRLAFPNLSMGISSYSTGKVVVLEVGSQGLPDIATARDMVVGLTGAEGALIDPVTGDFLFSTFGGGN